MIVYQSTKSRFRTDVATGDIDGIILGAFRRAHGRGVAQSEQRSWHQSLTHVQNVLGDADIPDDIGVSVELQIPQTSKRIDVVLTGQDEAGADNAVIIEIKQWESAEATRMDAIVRTWVGSKVREVSHPSYQAWSYASLLEDFNEAVYGGDIRLSPCAFLHNFAASGVLDDPFYREHTERAPLFLKSDVQKLQAFIKRHVKHGDRNGIIYRIDNGRIRPSKGLADSIAGLLKGNDEFVMIDEQKVVLERALAMARDPYRSGKQVLIVEGGPGTGKSVVAVNLLVRLIEQRQLTAYVTKNQAPRAVFESRLTGTMTKGRYSSLFKGSGAFITSDKDEFDVLVVDEAHRLNEHSGLYRNLGEHQIKEIIHAAGVSVFFLDEDQRVTLNDVGSREEILHWARIYGAEVQEMRLESQFRCNGSDGYIAWLDHVLQIRDTAHPTLDGIDFDFRVCSTPTELRELIFEKNRLANKARLVAGYCWKWVSKRDPEAFDINFPEHAFAMRWNLAEDGGLWLVKPNSVNESPCKRSPRFVRQRT